ncbi:MAG TPA: hypothetical protein VGN37_16685 [Actinocatenispora sp.]
MTTVPMGELRRMLADADPDIRWKARMLVLLPVSWCLEGAAVAAREVDDLLADPDPVVRRRAEDVRDATLQGELRHHVRLVLAVLADETAVHAWPGCIELLSAAVPGDGFGWMVTVLAKTSMDGLRDRLATALGLPDGRDLPRFTTDQAGADASVTCSCTRDPILSHEDDVYRTMPTAHCGRVAALVALLGSRHEPVRRSAVRELVGLGPGVAGVLRAVRRSRAPSRRGALAALVRLGWHELDPADRDLLTRFVRTRQAAETPTPLGPWSEWAAEWYALTTRTGLGPWSRARRLLPAAMRELPPPWNELTGERRLEHTRANERAALDALTAVLSDLPSASPSGWHGDDWEELFYRFRNDAGHRLGQVMPTADLVTGEGVTAVLREWATTADPPVPGWWLDQQSDQIVAEAADYVLSTWVYEVLRWLEREPRDVERVAEVVERCIAATLTGDHGVRLLHGLAAPHGEQALLRVVHDDRVREHTRAWAREQLVDVRRPGYRARGEQPAYGEEPLLPPAVRDLPAGWAFGFQWPPALTETQENIARARAVLEACAPTGPVPEPVPVFLTSFGGVWGGYGDVAEERPVFLEVRSVMSDVMPYARQVTRERMNEVTRECARLGMPGVPRDPHSAEGQRFLRQWVTWIGGWIADEVFHWLYQYVDDEDDVIPWAVELAERYLGNGMGGEHAMSLLRWYPDVPGSRQALARFAADEALVPELRELAGYELDDSP